MKKMFRLGATVMAFGAGLMMASGVANAANTTMMNTMSVKANPNEMMIVMPMNSMDKMPMAMMTGISKDSMSMMNDNAMMSQEQMAKMGTWNGVGSVMPSMMDMKQVDYKGAVTTFMSMYPNAQVTSISYDGKHNPTYEVEGYAGGQKIEMHIRETGEILGTEVKPMKHGSNGKHMKQHGSMMYGQAMKGMHGMSKAFDVNDIIMPEVAETKAQEKVGGTFEAMDWSVEKDNGRLMYELDMIDGSGKKAEVKVDAMTGEVINVKMKTSKY